MTRRFLGVTFPRWLSIAAIAAAAAAVLLGGVLLADARISRREVETLAAVIQARPGMTVAEIGAGTGWLAVEMARRVAPTGRVLATERSPDLREAVRRRAVEGHVSNVSIIEAGDQSTGLPAGCCDAIFMRHVYHHLPAPDAINASIRAALRPNGRLVIIECEPRTWPGILGLASRAHSVEPDKLRVGVTAAGLRFVRFHEWPGNQMYAAVFQSAEGPASHGALRD